MKKVLSLLLVLIALFSTLTSCNILPDSPTINPDNDGGTTTPINPTDPADRTNIPDENYTSTVVYSNGSTEEDDFINLFSADVKVELRLDISSEQLQLLQSDYEKYSSFGSKSPIYRKANLYVKMTLPNGNVKERFIEEVGIRMKGNTSRTAFYNSHDGMYNLIHFKISFGETFDKEAYYGSSAKEWTNSDARKERKNRTFATLEKMDIRWNKEDDATYIREIYSYDVYREMGVLAPHANVASVDMAGNHLGLYTIYEPVDDIFLEKNLSEDLLGGDLYKCGWGINGGASFLSHCSIGIEDEDNALFYAYDLKTNKKTSTHAALNNFISQMKKSNLTKDKIEQLMDVDNFISFAAVSWFLGNPDDLRNNYNNYYLYFTPKGKALFIPYDYDRTLGISHDWNPSGHGMTKDDPLTKDRGAGGKQENPVYLKTVVKGGLYVEEYKDRLSVIASSTLFSNARFVDRYEKAKKLYSGLTEPSKDFHNDGGHHTYFDINITADPSDGNGNISYFDYMTLKLETLHKLIGTGKDKEESGNTSDNENNNGNNNGNNEVYEVKDYYIRADFTNWEVKEGYKMTTTDGGKTYTFVVKVTSKNKLKVFCTDGDCWYGEESVDPDCTVEYTTDSHGNVALTSGEYNITYSAETKLIYIEKTK
jgi:spore coat protein CotH